MCVVFVFLTFFLTSVCNSNTPHKCHVDFSTFVSNKELNDNNKDKVCQRITIEDKNEGENYDRDNHHRVKREDNDKIFATTPEHYNPKKWSVKRKKEHSTLMRDYWKEHRQKGNPIHEKNYAKRRRLMSISMKDYWVRYKTEGDGNERFAKHAQKMVEHWQRQKDAGFTNHSEKMMEYWKQIKRDNNTDRMNLQKKIMEDYWIKLEKEGYKDQYVKELSEKMREKWKRIKEEGNTRQSSKLKAYWKKLKDTGSTERLQALKEFSRRRKRMKNRTTVSPQPSS
uniref:Uncharacterized protein n=1 Tax=Cacopsylla melanoneura TaxID=428564 RepID=A0A8D8XDA5_9HEMI